QQTKQEKNKLKQKKTRAVSEISHKRRRGAVQKASRKTIWWETRENLPPLPKNRTGKNTGTANTIDKRKNRKNAPHGIARVTVHKEESV
ncbi:MAG: hypothetical protein ACI3XE_00575, partial [Eubacteriales bacterium]